MRGGGQGKACDYVLQYVSGELDALNKEAFERHLPACPDCKKELEELREVWEVLSDDMERIEPPKEWKQQVLDAAFSQEERYHKKPARRWIRLGITAAALALMAAGTLWNLSMVREQSRVPLFVEEALSASAAQIERLVMLRPVSETEQAYGVACIVNNGRDKQFIVYVFGAKQTAGEEAYQVWLLRGNERISGGTFRVNDQGVGVLAMPIAGETLLFDEIGITLEPDDQGSQPRGERAFAM